MAKKSSKTSHVLSLLTNTEAAEDIKEEIVFESKDTTLTDSEELSETIRAQLEKIAEEEEQSVSEVTVSALNLEYFDEGESESEREDSKVMYTYVNIVEDIVKVKALDTMKALGVCTCNKCASDVMAQALNNLPPRYVVTEKGGLFSKLASYESQYSTDVTRAITEACIVVKEHPRHS